METVFLLHHSYEVDEADQTKFIGVYSLRSEAEYAIERLKNMPGFKDHPDAFMINEY